MKRIIVFVITATVLCMIASCGRKDNTEKEPLGSNSPDASTPAATSGQAVTGNEDDHANQTYIKSIFTDMSGREQVLDLGWIDMQNRPVKLLAGGLATGYCQVKDGHYYYLKQDRSGQYIVLYRDKGEKVAKVKCNMEQEVIQGAALGDDVLYLVCYDREILFDEDEFSYFVKCTNLKTGAVDVISLDDDFYEYWITNKYIYANENLDANEWYCIDKSTWKVIKLRSFDIYGADDLMDREYKQVIDEKSYYIIGEVDAPDEPYPFIQIDLEKGERKVLFEYTPGLKGMVYVGLEDMDEEAIYVREENDDEEALYKIPLHGGKMEKVESYGLDSLHHSSYKNHSVYIDKKNRIHHINRKKKTDTVISKKK